VNLIPDDFDFDGWLDQQQPDDTAKVRPASTWCDDVVDRFYGEHSEKTWVPTGFNKMRGKFDLRPAEVTLWAGINGHGKTTLLSQVLMRSIENGQRAGLASFEMKPHRTLERMLRQWVGFNAEAEFSGAHDAVGAVREVYEQFQVVADQRLWFYDQQGTVSADQVAAVTRYCAKELGIQHVFIDSLMKCVKGEDDYNGQKDFVDELTAIARDYRVHVHLVHHIRKLENELRKPDKTDVKGSGSITDQVDNVLLVWRNKAERSQRKESDPDAALIVAKQRNGEWEGGINLWFERDSQQFVGEYGAPAINFSGRWQ